MAPPGDYLVSLTKAFRARRADTRPEHGQEQHLGGLDYHRWRRLKCGLGPLAGRFHSTPLLPD